MMSEWERGRSELLPLFISFFASGLHLFLSFELLRERQRGIKLRGVGDVSWRERERERVA
jgi:hypothetical protein